MKQILAIVATLAFYVGVSTVAYGQATPYPPNPAYINANLAPIYPYRGTYYDPKQPGTGLQVDVGATGNAFVTYYSYDANGNTAWYIVQSTYQPSDEATRWTTGVIGTLTGPFYQAKHGQCLGCPYTPTGGAEVSPFTANLVWVNSREVKMTVGPQQWDFIAPNLDGLTDGDYLVGNWVIHFIQTYTATPTNNMDGNSGTFLIDQFASITISPDSGGLTVTPAAAAKGITPYKAGNKLYTWRCNELLPIAATGFPMCTGPMQYINLNAGIPGDAKPVPGVFEFWYDPDTHRLGMDVNRNGQITDTNTHIDLYLQSPNLIVGRGITEGTGIFTSGTSYYDLILDGAMQLQVVMQRIPDNSIGADNYNGNVLRR